MKNILTSFVAPALRRAFHSSLSGTVLALMSLLLTISAATAAVFTDASGTVAFEVPGEWRPTAAPPYPLPYKGQSSTFADPASGAHFTVIVAAMPSGGIQPVVKDMVKDLKEIGLSPTEPDAGMVDGRRSMTFGVILPRKMVFFQSVIDADKNMVVLFSGFPDSKRILDHVMSDLVGIKKTMKIKAAANGSAATAGFSTPSTANAGRFSFQRNTVALQARPDSAPAPRVQSDEYKPSICLGCGGKGRVFCHHCVGGYLPGTGNPYQNPPTPQAICPVCNGSKEKTCLDCRGTGRPRY